MPAALAGLAAAVREGEARRFIELRSRFLLPLFCGPSREASCASIASIDMPPSSLYTSVGASVASSGGRGAEGAEVAVAGLCARSKCVVDAASAEAEGGCGCGGKGVVGEGRAPR